MVSGVPKSGKRQRYTRWTVEQLYGLYQRWHAGETLQELASSVGSTRGRLRWAMEHHGLKAPHHIPKSPKHPEFMKPEPIVRRYDANEHRTARHYKGSFEL